MVCATSAQKLALLDWERILHHTNRQLNQYVLVVFEQVERKIISDAAERASIWRHLPLIFAYNKPGIDSFSSAFIKVGQGLEPGREANIQALIPFDNSVRESIFCLADVCRKKLQDELPDFLLASGGIHRNGVKLKSSAETFYNFVINYFRVGGSKITGDFEDKMVCHELFQEEVTNSNSANPLRNMTSAALMERISTSLTSFMD